MKFGHFAKVATLSVVAVLLCGCSTFDFMDSWFSGPGKVSKLKGERISVMSLDESLKADPSLASTPVVAAGALSQRCLAQSRRLFVECDVSPRSDRPSATGMDTGSGQGFGHGFPPDRRASRRRRQHIRAGRAGAYFRLQCAKRTAPVGSQPRAGRQIGLHVRRVAWSVRDEHQARPDERIRRRAGVRQRQAVRDQRVRRRHGVRCRRAASGCGRPISACRS